MLSKEDLAKANALALDAAGKPDATLKDLGNGIKAIAGKALDILASEDPEKRADAEARAYINAQNTASRIGHGMKRVAAPLSGIVRGTIKGAFSVAKSLILGTPSAEAADAIKKAKKQHTEKK